MTAGRARSRGAIAAAIALAAVAIVGAMLAVAGVVAMAGAERESETAAYAIALAAVLPAAYALARRSLSRAAPISSAAALATCGLAAATLLVLWIAGVAGAPANALRVAAIVLGIGLVAVAAVATVGSEGSPVRRHSLPSRWMPAAAALVACAALVPFLPSPVSGWGVLAAGAGALLAARFAPRLAGVALPAWARIGVDVALLALVVLVALDLTGYWGEDAASVAGGVRLDIFAPTAQVHQGYFLGPATDVLHGRALLVEADSAYGIGSGYAVAGWFQLVPIGYGTFTLLGSLAAAVAIAAGWVILRLARAPVVVIAVAVVAGLVTCVLAPDTPPTMYSNVGGMRFGPPLILILAMLFAARRERPVSWSLAAGAVFAFFSIWSVEAFVYCTGVWIAVVLAEALGAGRAGAARLVGRALLTAVAAFAAVHLAFSLLTLAFAGELPDWRMYVSLFRAWSRIVTDFDYFNDPIQPWSAVWVVGGVYVLSALALATALTARRGSLPRLTVVAIAGLTGGGAAMLTYFLSHPIDFYLLYISYPAILLVALWTSLALASSVVPWRRAAIAVATFVAVAMVAGTWSAARERAPRTALAHLLPGGPSFGHDWDLMWSSPPIHDDAEAAQALIEDFPGDEALVLTEPDLGLEALMRTGRANLLPSSYPPNDEVDLSHSLPPVEEAVAAIEPGTLMLTQSPPRPGEPIAYSLAFQQWFGSTPQGQRLGPLAQQALAGIEERFRLVPVERGPDGLRVVRLEPR